MFKHLVSTTAIVLLSWSWSASLFAAPPRPNIVFLLSDDQCTYSLGCYGNKDVQTPNIDALARDGMVFDNHYDTTAICMASRANIFTGMYEFKTGCNFDHGNLVREKWNQSYPVLLREAGYMTAIAGKIGITVAQGPDGKGRLPESDFDRWGAGPGQTNYDTRKNKSMADYADKYPHSTRSYGAFGRDFIRDAAKSESPFCLSISFKAPHHPVTPDPMDDDIYKDKVFRKPDNFGRENGEHFAPQSRLGRQYERFHSWNYSDKYSQVMAKYHQQIYAIDVAVGMIRDALKKHGVDKNTVVIYTSDNGFLCGSHGYGSKVLPYEEASRVPMIVYDPRHKNSGEGLRCNGLSGNVDFAPTILELCGAPVPESIDGANLMKLYDAPEEASIHPWLPLVNVWGPASTHCLGVVTKQWKYIYWPYENREMKATEEMYNTGGDPLELSELSTTREYEPDLQRMRKLHGEALKAWQNEAVPFHRYEQYGKIFDREIPWSEKAALIRDRGK